MSWGRSIKSILRLRFVLLCHYTNIKWNTSFFLCKASKHLQINVKLAPHNRSYWWTYYDIAFNWQNSILVINPTRKCESLMTINYTKAPMKAHNVYSSNAMKLRHSTICTLYSSEKHSFCRTKCIRRNMRSTCQWSCVLQFTRRRAVCCGLHRPMSQVIPCLGLKFKNVFIFI